MAYPYKIFSIYTDKKDGGGYFQECVEKEIVLLVATTKRKYATVEWDLITLDNSKQMRIGDKGCSLGYDIEQLYMAYIKRVDFKKRDLNYQIQSCCGIFYIYKDDAEDILTGIGLLIEKMLESNCIEYSTPAEVYKDIPEELRKYIGNRNLGL